MRILGIDCGTERTGYGVIESDGRTHRVVVSGVIRTRPAEAMYQRLLVIAKGLRKVIREHLPDSVAVEEVFQSANVKSALKLAQARGVALLAAAEAELPLGEYSPLEIKMSVVGYGQASKQQVQMMVTSLLCLNEVPPEDASDALAVAICHATRTAQQARLGVCR